MKRMPKKILLAALAAGVLAAGSIIALASCETDSYDYGTAYLALDWSPSWEFYADLGNTDLPSIVDRNVSYAHYLGNYSFTYYVVDPYDDTASATFLVEYSIVPNRGEPGSYIADKFFTIYCGWNGIVQTGFSIRGTVAVEADGTMINEQTIGDTSLRAVYRRTDSPRSANILQMQD